MSAISDYAQEVETTLTRIKTDFVVVQVGLAAQAATIQDLQQRLNANGALTADDKTVMDKLVGDAASLADAADRIASAAQPPSPPTT